MSLWNTTWSYVRFRRVRYWSYAVSRASSGANSLSSISPIAVTSVLRTAGLLVQPSADAPSGWLVLSALFGLPIALWAYKVRPPFSVDGSEMIDSLGLPTVPDACRVSTQGGLHG